MIPPSHTYCLMVPQILEGISLNNGVGMGYAYFPKLKINTIQQYHIFDHNLEAERLNIALTKLDHEISSLIEVANLNEESKNIYKTLHLLAKDCGWHKRITEKIHHSYSCEQAIQSVLADLRARFSQDEFWQSRLMDIENISNRLMSHLSNNNTQTVEHDPNLPKILIAETIDPIELLKCHKSNLKGVILSDSSELSHMAIISRSLGVPVIGGIENIESKIRSNDYIVVDGDIGKIYIRPIPSILKQFDEKIIIAPSKPAKQAHAGQVATKDGIPINLSINANLQEDLGIIEQEIIHSVGLFRTEVPFILSQKLLTVSEQVSFYKDILNRSGQKPVYFRTLDIGGDKIIPQLKNKLSQKDVTKIKGWRSVRVALDLPVVMRQQIRAIIQSRLVSNYPQEPLYIMIPMVADTSEFLAAKYLIDLEYQRAQSMMGLKKLEIYLGIVIEVPSLLYELPYVLSLVDFITIGSNDLFQFFYGVDRYDQSIRKRYDTISPAFLQCLKSIIQQCDKAKIPVSLCGEMGGDTLAAMCLIGLGLRHLSVSPSQIGKLLNMITSLDVSIFSPFLELLSKQYQANIFPVQTTNFRQKIQSFAIDHKVSV